MTPQTALLSIYAFFYMLLFPVQAFSMPEYALQTGKPCKACHIDPAGGGPLTPVGKTFRAELKSKGLYRTQSTVHRLLYLLVGYLHLLTAILWFGAILYVHLLLKPAYAARGLPKGELWVGWVSIGIMTLTGILLTMERIPSWSVLIHTRFGILLLVKIALFCVMVAAATLVTFWIGPRLKQQKNLKREAQKQDLALEELAQFDGQDDSPAYFGYDGAIYDVSKSPLWKKGQHMGRHRAGMDLTELLKQAPHNEEKIFAMKRVGKVLASGKRNRRRPEMKVFYFFSYLNLVLVFLIIFVISLWRWW